MEENENMGVNGNFAGKVESLKKHKGLIIAVVAALVAICLIYNVFFNTKGKAKSVINTFFKSLGSGKYEKALKQIDPAGMYAFQGLDKDEYEDFWNEYKELKKSDEWEEKEEDWKEVLENAKDAEEDFDKDDAVKVSVKKITKFKKVGKNLYEVKAKIESKVDDDTDTETVSFYIMKDGLGCKIVGGDAISSALFSVGMSSVKK